MIPEWQNSVQCFDAYIEVAAGYVITLIRQKDGLSDLLSNVGSNSPEEQA
jgi:hypothetical protein